MTSTERRAVKMREAARAMRESYATEKLDAVAIVAKAATAAALGYCSVRIAFDRALDVRGTEAGRTVNARLQREGFGVNWEPRRIEAKDSPTGETVTVFDLLVSWS